MNKLQKLIGIGTIAIATTGLAGCVGIPRIIKMGDMTGDGIPDVIVQTSGGLNSGTYLFIGQKDGTYLRTKESLDGNYFVSDDGKRFWFFDGVNYKEGLKSD